MYSYRGIHFNLYRVTGKLAVVGKKKPAVVAVVGKKKNCYKSLASSNQAQSRGRLSLASLPPPGLH